MAFYNKGIILEKLGRKSEEILDCFKQAADNNQNFALALFGKGVVQQDLKKLTEALESYDRMISKIPNFMNAIYNKAICLHILKHRDAALDCYK